MSQFFIKKDDPVILDLHTTEIITHKEGEKEHFVGMGKPRVGRIVEWNGNYIMQYKTPKIKTLNQLAKGSVGSKIIKL